MISVTTPSIDCHLFCNRYLCSVQSLYISIDGDKNSYRVSTFVKAVVSVPLKQQSAVERDVYIGLSTLHNKTTRNTNR